MTKALVIEPKESIHRQIRKTLKDQDIAVQFLPVRAADKLLASHPDLVLLDVELPGGDGLELAQRIRGRAPEVPIIFLASRPSGPAVDEALRLGATVFLTKPFKPDELVHRIKTAMIRHRRMKPSAEVPRSLVDSLTAHMLPDLHDPSTGRLDSKRIASYLRIPLSSLAGAIGKSVAAVHKSPAAVSLQGACAPTARSLAILSRLLGSRDSVLAWLNSPHPDLGRHTPLDLILAGKGIAVTEMLEAVLAGQPS